jgi:hypothetical protein
VAGSRWGINGIAGAWLVLYPWFLLALVRRALAVVELPVREYVASFWPAFSASAVMGGAVVLAHRALGPDTPPAVRLGVEVFLGAGSYLLVMATLHRREAHRLAAFWRGSAS